MATDHSSTSITVGFDNESDAGKANLLIEDHYSSTWNTSYFFRLYPNVSASLVTAKGVIAPTGFYYSPNPTEYITFSGSNSGSTKYPITSLNSASLIGGFAVDEDGNGISGITFYLENGQIKASQSFYGGVEVNYYTSCAVYEWKQYASGPVSVLDWWNRYTDFFDVAIRIFAFYKGATAQKTIEYQTPVYPNNAGEVYRVTSEYIADRDGQWELPPNWPTSNEYASPKNEVTGPNLKAFQKLERTHEIMTISTSGTTSLDRQQFKRLQPYEPYDTDYDPVYKYQKGSAASGFESIFLDLDWDSIESSVQDRYPGVQI